jgi:DNA-binding NarL/FixJ family response regulator
MNKISLLLVDDHAVVRAGYRQLMSASPTIQVVGESETAEKACQLYLDLKPDVVVMDLSLPGMSGLEAVRRISSRDPSAAIMAFTIHDELIYLERALEAGAQGYLTKSCDPSFLLEGIEQLALGQQYIDPLMVDKWQQKKALKEAKGMEEMATLSPREFDVYCLLVKGQTSQQISESLSLGQKTIANYATQIKVKLGVKTIAEMVHLASQQKPR